MRISVCGAGSLLLGLAPLSYFLLLFGGLGLLSSQLLRFFLLLAAGWGLFQLFSWRRRLPELHLRPLVVVLGLALLLSIAPSVVRAFSPPDEVDLVHYHLRAPLLWLRTGRVSWPFRQVVYHYPLGMETLYALGIGVGGLQVPKLLHLMTGLATLWGIMSFARARWGIEVALLAGLFYWAIPEVYYLATTTLVDLAWSGAEVLAFFVFFEGVEDRSSGRWTKWLLAGALVGWAAAIKYSALMSALILTGGIAWVCLREGQSARWRDLLKGVGCFVVAALLLGGFWYLKNWVLFGNPVYPFLWGGRGLSPEVAHAWTGLLRMFGPSRSLWRFLRLPWDLFMSLEIPAMRPGLYPYPLALFPLLLLRYRGEQEVRWVLAYNFLYAALWYWGGTMQKRFLLAPIALGALLSARALERDLTELKFGNMVVLGSVGLALVLGLMREWQGLFLSGIEEVSFPLEELWIR